MSDDRLFRLLQETATTRHSRRQILKRAAALGLSAPVVGALLTACGGSEDEETPAPAGSGSGSGTNNATATTGQTGGSATPQPSGGSGSQAPANAKQGGRVVIPLNGEPKLLNPILRGSVAELFINNAVFDALAQANPETLESEPQLAEKWEVASDGSSITATLKPNLKWHDGQAVTADDVKFTFDKVKDKNTNTGFAVNVSDLASTDVVDPQTVRFNLNPPSAAFISSMQIQLIPKHILESSADINKDDFNQNPLGCGPFKFKSISAGDEVVLTANADYHRGRPHLDELVFKVIPDVNVRLAQIQTGELTVVDGVEPVQLKQLERNQNLTVYRMDQTNYYAFFINWQKPPFDDIRVRRALNHAIDKQAIIDKVLLGEARLADSVFPPPFSWAYTDDVETQEFSPDKAKALLEEAGWKDTNGDGIREKDGQPFAFMLTGDSGSPTRRQIVTLAQQYFKDVGIDVQIQFKEWNDFLENFQWSPDKEMTFLWNAFNPPLDPDALARRWKGTSSDRENQCTYKNPKVDELFDLAKAEFDQAKRAEYYKEIQTTIAADVPFVIVYYPVEIAVTSKALQGVVPSPFRVYHNYQDWWLDN